jgi:hypothetical protein
MEFGLFWVLSVINKKLFLSHTSCDFAIVCPDKETKHFEVSFICKDCIHIFMEAFVNGKPLYLIIYFSQKQ